VVREAVCRPVLLRLAWPYPLLSRALPHLKLQPAQVRLWASLQNRRGGAEQLDGRRIFVSVELVGFLAGGLPANYITFLPAVLMVGVFYLLLFRPNQKKQKQWQEMLGNLKIGDKITTTGGMRGTIVALRDDAIQLKLPPDGVKVEIVKSAIAAVTTNTPEEAK
jgi:preprotein translocase subunit YajC